MPHPSILLIPSIWIVAMCNQLSLLHFFEGWSWVEPFLGTAHLHQTNRMRLCLVSYLLRMRWLCLVVPSTKTSHLAHPNVPHWCNIVVVCPHWLWQLPVTNFGQNKNAAPHPGTFDCRFQQGEARRAWVAWCCFCRQKPWWGVILKMFWGRYIVAPT